MEVNLSILEILKKLTAEPAYAEKVSMGLRTGTLDLYSVDEVSLEWDLITNICEGVRENKWGQLSSKQRIALLIDVFEFLPHYTSSSHLYKAFAHDDLDPQAKITLWNGLISQISSENEYARKPIEYVLWVDFFEDQKTCKEAWSELTSRASCPNILDRLLVIAGPVPFDLKQPFYERLSSDQSRHGVLAESLAHSINDYYGQIDLEEAKKYLKILMLPMENAHFSFLRDHLEN